MAKDRSLFSKKPAESLVEVNSRAYGRHFRAKRGTYKPAVLNEALKKNGTFIGVRNKAASQFRKAVQPIAGNLVNGKFWPDLLSCFSSYYKEHDQLSWHALEGFEVNKRYPFDRFGVRFENGWMGWDDNGKLKIDANKINAPKPHHNDFESYNLRLYLQTQEAGQEGFTIDQTAIKVTSKGIENHEPLFFSRRQGDLVVLVKLEGVKEGRIDDALQSTGMKVCLVLG
ncbi:MAG: hypothetical protein WD555_05095 [Fulvivirga sp.]